MKQLLLATAFAAVASMAAADSETSVTISVFPPMSNTSVYTRVQQMEGREPSVLTRLRNMVRTLLTPEQDDLQRQVKTVSIGVRG